MWKHEAQGLQANGRVHNLISGPYLTTQSLSKASHVMIPKKRLEAMQLERSYTLPFVGLCLRNPINKKKPSWV